MDTGRLHHARAFLGRKALACNKACPWWPGDRSGHNRESRKVMV